MRRNDLSEFRLEQEGFKITLKRGSEPQIVATGGPVLATAFPAPATLPAPAPAPAETPAAEKLREITSPMVGTFYASATPESAAFVSAGKAVSEESVVCIIEAMKVMNEIKAELKGTIVEVVAENGKPVQYGQVLFRVR